MVAPDLIYPSEAPDFIGLLRPDPSGNGTEPEQRVVYCGISWARYLTLDKQLGENRPGPRFYYLDGELEIMSTSEEHERLKKWVAGLLELYFDEIDLDLIPRGQATVRSNLHKTGAEPGESWCIGEKKKFPDLVLEIALTSGGVKKLEIYQRLGIREVWFWRRNKLEIFCLDRSGAYQQSQTSQLLPSLSIPLLQRCAMIPSWKQARQAFRARRL